MLRIAPLTSTQAVGELVDRGREVAHLPDLLRRDLELGGELIGGPAAMERTA
jgi:hypothetical protein